MGARQVQEELAYYRRKVEENPGMARTHFDLASAYYRNGILWEAEKEYLKTTELDSSDVEAWFYLGLCRASLAKDGEAVEAFERAAGQRKQDKSVRWIRCMAMSQLSRVAEAVACMEEDIKDDPENCRKLNVMARLYKAQRSSASLLKAEIHLKKAAQHCPQSFESWDELGKFYFLQGRYQEMVNAYCMAFPFQPDPRYRLGQMDVFRDLSQKVPLEVPCLLPGEEQGFTPKNLVRPSQKSEPVPLVR